jgi:hypothetical protein
MLKLKVLILLLIFSSCSTSKKPIQSPRHFAKNLINQ